MTDQVKLGYVLDQAKGATPAVVNIPIRHMVVAGQTQEAGKTTTLEALIARSDKKAIAFVTKRGEQSFATGRRIRPYFRERADWQFVASILEATMRERMKFERSWIIQASKGARTLADVQKNVRKALQSARGISEGVYTSLDAYLEIVVPRIASVQWAPTLALGPGLNVLDLSDGDTFPIELQSLVMRSVLEAVYQKHEDVITIIPEAWEFLPQNRGSPVKLAAEELIRKGASLKNYVWLDSQDIGGIDKNILRSCPVWLLGVQREANEIKRTLANVPDTTAKPKPSAIATLERGQFFACYGKHATKTYVQPEWMSSADAEEIAAGELSASVVLARRPIRRERTFATTAQIHARVDPEVLIDGLREGFSRTVQLAAPPPRIEEDELMSNEALQKLDRITQLLEQLVGKPAAAPAPHKPSPRGYPHAPPAPGEQEAEDQLFERFRDRLMQEAPKLIKVLEERPEIQLKIERVTVEVDLKSARGMVAKIIVDGFFDETRTANAAWKEICQRWDYRGNAARVYEQCDWYNAAGILRKDPESGYRVVPGMKACIVE